MNNLEKIEEIININITKIHNLSKQENPDQQLITDLTEQIFNCHRIISALNIGKSINKEV